MSKFLKILKDNNVDPETGLMETPGVLNINFKTLLNEAFKEILEKNSSLYRDMIEKGVTISFEKFINLPDAGLSGELKTFIEQFKQDTK